MNESSNRPRESEASSLTTTTTTTTGRRLSRFIRDAQLLTKTLITLCVILILMWAYHLAVNVNDDVWETEDAMFVSTTIERTHHTGSL